MQELFDAVRESADRAAWSRGVELARSGAVLGERADDDEVRELVGVLDDAATATAVSAERAFLRRLGGGCLAPATAHARIAGQEIEIRALVADPDGRRMMRERVTGPIAEGDRLADDLAARLLDSGASGLLEAARRAAEGPPPS